MPTETVPDFWADEVEHRRKMSLAINAILRGQLNNCVAVTLDANETTTTVSDARVTPETFAALVPTSSDAAILVGAGLVWTTTSAGVVTIHHDSSPSTARTFGLIYFC